MTLPSIHRQDVQRRNQTQLWLKKTRKQVRQILAKAHNQRGLAEQARHKDALKMAIQRVTQHQTLHTTLQMQLANDVKTLLKNCNQLRAQRAKQLDQRLASLNQLLERQVAAVTANFESLAHETAKPTKIKKTPANSGHTSPKSDR